MGVGWVDAGNPTPSGISLGLLGFATQPTIAELVIVVAELVIVVAELAIAVAELVIAVADTNSHCSDYRTAPPSLPLVSYFVYISLASTGNLVWIPPNPPLVKGGTGRIVFLYKGDSGGRVFLSRCVYTGVGWVDAGNPTPSGISLGLLGFATQPTIASISAYFSAIRCSGSVSLPSRARCLRFAHATRKALRA